MTDLRAIFGEDAEHYDRHRPGYPADLLLTYSGHRALSPDRRAGLFACITALVDRRGGRITKRFMTELAAARVT
ncbi:hypothetical protein ACQPW3_12225 [Actinosynnema sp. CA-248983]